MSERKSIRFEKMMCRAPWRSDGFSLIEILVGIGLLMTAAMGLLSMFDFTNSANAQVTEQLSILDLDKNLISLAAGKNICEKAFSQSAGLYTFDADAFPPESIPIDELYFSPEDSMPFIKKGDSLGTTKMKIKDMTLENISGGGTSFIADLIVRFEASRISRKPVSTKVNLTGALDRGKLTLKGCWTSQNYRGTGAEIESQAECESLGGSWVMSTDSSRPGFCVMSGYDILEWY